MNNKGFAITGILYTIFILFIMTLLAILSGLKTRTKLLQKSLDSFQDDYTTGNTAITSEIATMNTNHQASFDGKYTFNNECIAYLKKGKAFAGATCINNTTLNGTETLSRVDKFE